MTNTRTDIHRPSAPEFDPTHYQLHGVYYLGSSPCVGGGTDADRGRHTRAINTLRAQGWTRGGVYGSRQCSHCGAHLTYAALMLHTPTQTFLHIGEDCLDNRFELDSAAEFAALRKASALNREQLRKEDRITKLVEAHPLLAALLDAACASAYGGFVADVGYRFRKDGRLSERQIAAIERAIPAAIERAHQAALWDAERLAEAALAQPAPVGRIVVTGQVLTVKTKDTEFGLVRKMTVRASGGYRVYVTEPAGIEVTRGDWVTFTATLKQAADDPTMAWGTRPTKAEIVPAPSFG